MEKMWMQVTWMEMALLIVLLIAVTALLVVAGVSAQQRQMQRDVQENLRLFRLEIDAAGRAAVAPRQLQQDGDAAQAQKEPACAEVEHGYAPYSQATQLLNAGASIDDLVRRCGISRAEAELMRLVHRQMKRRGSHPW